jgi:hypothetical protein
MIAPISWDYREVHASKAPDFMETTLMNVGDLY